jgi:hypothetical protein
MDRKASPGSDVGEGDGDGVLLGDAVGLGVLVVDGLGEGDMPKGMGTLNSDDPMVGFLAAAMTRRSIVSSWPKTGKVKV